MLTKRSTVYFDPAIHRVLKLMAIETDQSISDIVNEAIRHELAQDQEDLAVFAFYIYICPTGGVCSLSKIKNTRPAGGCGWGSS